MLEFDFMWVLLLLPLPLLVYYFLPPHRQHSGAVIVPYYQTATQLSQPHKGHRRPALCKTLLLSALWLLLLLAAAKPQWVGEPQALPTSGRNILLAVDISDSMAQEDMRINGKTVSRLIAVKEVVSEFIERRQGDRIGLVLFGTNAYLQVPLTFDTGTVKQFLQESQLGFAGTKTAIGDAIGLSVKRLKDRAQYVEASNARLEGNSTNKQVIILLTDGANTAGEIQPLQAATLAQQINTKIYTIGIGADEMVVRSFFGNRRVNPSASLDEETLQGISQMTGGQYFRARDTDELNNIYQELDKLEPIEQDKQWLRPTRSLFMWPLGTALIISLLYVLFSYRLIIQQAWSSTLTSFSPRDHHSPPSSKEKS